MSYKFNQKITRETMGGFVYLFLFGWSFVLGVFCWGGGCLFFVWLVFSQH